MCAAVSALHPKATKIVQYDHQPSGSGQVSTFDSSMTSLLVFVDISSNHFVTLLFSDVFIACLLFMIFLLVRSFRLDYQAIYFMSWLSFRLILRISFLTGVCSLALVVLRPSYMLVLKPRHMPTKIRAGLIFDVS